MTDRLDPETERLMLVLENNAHWLGKPIEGGAQAPVTMREVESSRAALRARIRSLQEEARKEGIARAYGDPIGDGLAGEFR